MAQNGTQTLTRAFQLIKFFDDHRPVWSLAELIEASGLARTTVHRLTAALENEGLLRKLATGEFTLGPQLIVWGGRAIRANNLRTIAQPFLDQLVSTSTESVTIDTLWVDDQNRPSSLVIEEKLGRHVMGMAQYIGGRFPAHTTSTGKVLLAWQTDSFLQMLNLDELEPLTAQTVQSAEVLLEELTQVKAQGYAFTQDELEIGLSAIAAPIFNHHDEIQAALCIAAPSRRLVSGKLSPMIEQLKATAAEISAAIGYEKKTILQE